MIMRESVFGAADSVGGADGRVHLSVLGVPWCEVRPAMGVAGRVVDCETCTRVVGLHVAVLRRNLDRLDRLMGN